ncbi:MAG: choice-of-anchor Q domain-containing protein, partial [Bacteroidota bacterium]
TFSGNQGGGMVSHSDENSSLTNVTFNNNSAWEGGGMVNYYGNPSLVKVTFINNSAQHGGGMYDSGSPGLVNVAFSGNTAYYEGGGMYTSGSPSLVNVTFSNNTAGYGGGMRNYGGSPRLTNVTFSGNSGDWGGGMYSHFGSPRLTNVTFSGNSAFRGGGIYSDSGSPILINSILYGDTGGEISKDQGSVAVTYSIVQDGYPGTGNLNTDPLLQSLGDNGGFTETMALGAGSPAIDKGTNTGCPAKDQRGVVRPQRQRCDMGAYEYPDSKLSLSSAGAYDGWVLEAGEDSGVGGTLNAAGSALVAGDTAQDRQYRSILSFKTGVLPDGAVITSVVLKLKGAGVAGTDPFSTHGSLLVDVRKGVFSDDAALQIQDFQAPSSQDAVMTILNKPINGWYTRGMGLGGFAYINKAGPTQFRLRFAVDDNDDGAADYIKFYSGNVTMLAYRPQLIITYYMP